METCKNCNKKIVWASLGKGKGFAYLHIETELQHCFPNDPVAEPQDNVLPTDWNDSVN